MQKFRDVLSRWERKELSALEAGELLGSPTDEKLRDAYEAAVSILKLSPGEPQVIEETRIDDLVHQIEDEIRADHSAPR